MNKKTVQLKCKHQVHIEVIIRQPSFNSTQIITQNKVKWSQLWPEKQWSNKLNKLFNLINILQDKTINLHRGVMLGRLKSDLNQKIYKDWLVQMRMKTLWKVHSPLLSSQRVTIMNMNLYWNRSNMSKVNTSVWLNKDKSYFIIRRHDKNLTLIPNHPYLTTDTLQ